jgi:hypothetical protein
MKTQYGFFCKHKLFEDINMKTVIKSTLVAIALTALAAGPASAMVSQADIAQSISSITGSGDNVFVSVRDGVVTLTGTFADGLSKSQALQAALSTEGVEKVINHATQSN